MVERLLARDPSCRIEREQTGKQVERERVCLRVQVGERDPRLDGQGADVLLSPRRAYAPERVLGRCAEEVEDLVELIDVVASLEDGLAAEQLGEDAPDRPHVDCKQRLKGQHGASRGVHTSAKY